jgi:uncharacterized membrane protein
MLLEYHFFPSPFFNWDIVKIAGGLLGSVFILISIPINFIITSVRKNKQSQNETNRGQPSINRQLKE